MHHSTLNQLLKACHQLITGIGIYLHLAPENAGTKVEERVLQ
jgi:hypothetical protein